MIRVVLVRTVIGVHALGPEVTSPGIRGVMVCGEAAIVCTGIGPGVGH